MRTEKEFKILQEISNTTSRTEKESILKRNKDDDDLKTILQYTFNPYLIFGIGKKSFDDTVTGETKYKCIFDLLDYVLANNTGTDKVKLVVNTFINNQPNEDRLWIKRILLKDLKIGISDKTINKIWNNFIPTFNVMLAKKYFEHEDKVNSEFVITTKLDGVRCMLLKDHGDIKIMSRQGKVFEGLIEVEEDLKRLPDNMAYDGELLAINTDDIDSKDLYRKTMNLATKKGDKLGLIHNCFDMIPIDEFKQGKSKENCIARKNKLHEIFKDAQIKHITEVPVLYQGKDKNKIIKLLDKAIGNHQEGVMVNLDKPYVCRRTDNILKVKKMQTCDCRITGFEEGTGRLENTLGAILIDYKGNTVRVGSGYSDNDREYIWKNKEQLTNKIVEVQYFEETNNQKNDSISLRFPVFVQLRKDKVVPSYN